MFEQGGQKLIIFLNFAFPSKTMVNTIFSYSLRFEGGSNPKATCALELRGAAPLCPMIAPPLTRRSDTNTEKNSLVQRENISYNPRVNILLQDLCQLRIVES